MPQRPVWIVTGLLAFLGLAVGLFYLTDSEPTGPLPQLATEWHPGMSVATRLESAQSAVGDGRVTMALHMTLEPGWKTYWRVPGDSGLAPRFDWSGSKNVQTIELLWPTPQAFDELGERFYGYKDDVIWPLRVTANDPGQAVDLSLKLDFGVCADVCVPTSINNSLSVPAGPAGETAHAALIELALGQVPGQAHEEHLSVTARLMNVKGYRADLNIAVSGDSALPTMVVASGIKGAYLSASGPREENSFLLQVETNDPASLKGKAIKLLFLYDDGAPGIEGTFFIE